jgi:hypothetical protein
VGFNGCRLVQSMRVQTYCQFPTAMQGCQQYCSRVRAMTGCKPRGRAWSLVTGCGRDVSIELRIVETNAVQRDEKPSSLKALLLLRPLESRLHSNA